MSDDVDSTYYRTEAARCLWLAQLADEPTAEILRRLAAGYAARAAELSAGERLGQPVKLRAVG